MRPFYWRDTTNFGDAMNGWLWSRLLPDLVDREDGLRLVGVGSLIRNDLARVQGLKVVFGSGAGYGHVPDPGELRNWRIICVRGPLTARALGLPRRTAVVDGAWLVNRFPEWRKAVGRREGTVFVPHFKTGLSSNWRRICGYTGIQYLDPLNDCDEVLRGLQRAKLALVESLHGAILADLFRTPWIPLRLSPEVNAFKWLDWCRSVEVDYAPVELPLTDIYHHVVNRALPRAGTHYVRRGLDESQVRWPIVDPGAGGLVNNRRYRARQFARAKAKRVLAPTRFVGSRLANQFPASRWNDRQTERLAGLLEQVARDEAPVLSQDTVRAGRLAELDERLDQLQRDYPALVEAAGAGSVGPHGGQLARVAE